MKMLSLQSLFGFITVSFLTTFLFACNSQPKDEDLQKTITDSLQTNAVYKSVTAAVADGVVTLSGTCTGNNCVTNAEQKIKNINGVKSVSNNVTMAQESTDLTLRTQVQSVVTRYDGVQADVANGVVVLRGTIARAQLQPLMTELSTLKASKIDNQLAVK